MESNALPKAVLIVDDDTTLREMYEDYLKASDFSVTTAQDGEEGLLQAANIKPSVILLDLMMPKMNGIEVLRHLKSDPNLMYIPVIVFTALIQDLEQQECYAAGASDYVVKTEVTPRAIVEKINQLIADPTQKTGTPPAGSIPATVPAPPASPPPTA